jgi:hypothetical protein
VSIWRGVKSTDSKGLPAPGTYQHFKGKKYQLLSVGKHTETGELLAVYHSANQPARVWVRPLEMFTDYVDGPDGSRPRFQPAASAASRRALVAAFFRGLPRALSRHAARYPSAADRSGTLHGASR